MSIKPGDILVLATDGLLDNVFPDEMADLVGRVYKAGKPPAMAAKVRHLVPC